MNDYKKIENNALSYWYAYKVLSDYNQQQSSAASDIPSSKRELKLAFGPHIVVLSFCTELYLKALHCLLGVKSKLKGNERHNTYLLFKELPDQIQEDVFNAWLLATGRDQTKEHFTNNLINNQNAFYEWRYLHEPRKKITKYPSAANGLFFGTTVAECFVSAIRSVFQANENMIAENNP